MTMPEQSFPPPGACDCHVHVIGPKLWFPLAPDRSYTPPDATLGQLRDMLARLGLERVVVVQPSIYGADNACTLAAVDALGYAARAVAVLAPDTPGSDADELHRRGVRGLRVNVVSSLRASADAVREPLDATAALCARNGWHLQAYIPAEALEPLAPTLLALPVPVVIDHFGLIPAHAQSEPQLRALLDLLESGRVWVKLSAPYRIADDPFDPATAPLARRLAAANPERVVWGSDWPHTPPHGGHAVDDDRELPYRDLDTAALLALVREWFAGEEAMIARLLVENPARLYDFH
jgi:predicted TIM-barrel fold metal-dependent hydrolase